MQRRTVLASLIAGCLILTLGAFTPAQAQSKASPVGTWQWTTQGRNGGADRTNTMVLKMEGDKLTGTITAPGRQGQGQNETKIEDAKMAGEELTFSVTRSFNGNSMTMKYSGKVSADAIKGKVERDGGNGQARDWEAKRVKSAK